MSLSHLTLSTRDVEKTAAFFEKTLGYARDPFPGNVPCETAWLNIGRDQQIHVVYVEGFEVSRFEGEFGGNRGVLPAATIRGAQTTPATAWGRAD